MATLGIGLLNKNKKGVKMKINVKYTKQKEQVKVKQPYGVITYMDGTEKVVFSESELWEEQNKEVALRGYC